MAVVRTGPDAAHTRDIGPAAGYGGGDNGRLASLEVRTPADMRESAIGSGPVEVRHERPEERTARLLREAFPPAPEPRPVVAKPAPPRPRKEEPVAPEPIPMIVGALPCSTCAHRPVCRIPETVTEIPDVRELEQGVLVRATWQIVECAHHLPERAPVALRAHDRPAIGSPEAMAESRRRGAEAHVAVMAAKRQPGRHPGGAGEASEKAERARRAMAAIERHGGDRKAAAAELGMKANAVAMVAKFAGAREAAS